MAAAKAPSTPQAPPPQAQANATSEVPKYEPNYKFTIGKEEKEFDEFIRAAIKDKESEEKLRELYTRAHGLDSIKERHKQTQEYLKSERAEKEQLQGFYKQLDTFINQGDFQAFLDATGIKEEIVLKWVKDRLEYEELAPEKKYAYDRDREFRKNSYAESARLQALEQQNREILTQQRNFELDAALSKPEVQEVLKAYDEMAQRQGIPTFRQEVINRGIAKFHAHRQDSTAEQLVQEMTKMFSHMVQRQAPPAQPTQIVAQQKPPVIPHVGGGNTSPVERQIRTLEDLEKLREERSAAR